MQNSEKIRIRYSDSNEIDIIENEGKKLVRFSSFADGHFQDETIVPIEEFCSIAENRPAKNIVFLDIDGVMTSIDNGTSYLCESEENYKIDEECKLWLSRLWTDVPDLKIVISSAWCNRGALDDRSPNWPWKGIPMHSPLPSLYWWLLTNNKFYGNLDNRCRRNGGVHVSKYRKILDWWVANPDKRTTETKVLVLDDDDTDYNDLTKINEIGDRWHYQKVDYHHGFNSDEYKKALEFFNG